MKSNRLVLSIILTIVLIWVNTIFFFEDYFSILSLLYNLRNEKDLGGIIGYLSIVVIHVFIINAIINSILNRKIALLIIFMLAFLILHLPIIYIGVKKSDALPMYPIQNPIKFPSYLVMYQNIPNRASLRLVCACNKTASYHIKYHFASAKMFFLFQ
jgi:hypothetical protein